MENRIDDLNADFSRQTSEQVTYSDMISALEQEVVRQMELANQAPGKAKNKRAENLAETTRKLNDAKGEMMKMQLKCDQTKEALDKATLELANNQTRTPDESRSK